MFKVEPLWMPALSQLPVVVNTKVTGVVPDAFAKLNCCTLGELPPVSYVKLRLVGVAVTAPPDPAPPTTNVTGTFWVTPFAVSAIVPVYCP